MELGFGKYKGQQFENTPKSYQDWLLKQSWFKAPKQEKSLHKQLNGWDGNSRKGEAIYDDIFEEEKKQCFDNVECMVSKALPYTFNLIIN